MNIYTYNKDIGGLSMKKVFNLEELDCANCARKMEEAGRKIDGVLNLSINFMTLKMKLEAEDERFDEVLKEVIKEIKKVEPECKVIY